eukprot:gene14217-30240_t
MCILAILIPNPDSQVPLIICSNRDEDFIRPTQKGHIRTETLEYSPIDKKGGGSWIGIEAKYGRCAVVLNYDTWRDGKTSSNLSDEFLSRGQLTMDFIQADKDITAEIYAEKVNRKSSLYRGFSLVVGDTNGFYYVSNHNNENIIRLNPGQLYCISNGPFINNWEKCINCKNAIQNILNENLIKSNHNSPSESPLHSFHNIQNLSQLLMSAMCNNTPLNDPTHGNTSETFMRLAAIFVEPTIPPDETEIFGTRTVTVIIRSSYINDSKSFFIFEKDLDVESNIWTLNSFSLPNLEADEEDEVEDEVIL